MKIKEIVDKIIKEADVVASEYTVVDRLVDIHQTRLELQMLKMQLGPYDTVKPTQTETLVAGDQSFVRDIKHKDIVQIRYRATVNDDWICLEKAKNCEGSLCGNVLILEVMKFSYDINTIYIWEAEIGLLEITYADSEITEWVEADYITNTLSPTELDNVYHKLLFLTQVVRNSGYYTKERYQQLAIEYKDLYESYYDSVNRKVELDMEIDTGEPDNNR